MGANRMSPLALLLALGVVLSLADMRLARQAQGEAGLCGRDAILAAANVCERSTCYADQEPTLETLWLVAHRRELDDPSQGAVFLVSDADLLQERVRGMVGEPLGTWDCEHGY